MIVADIVDTCNLRCTLCWNRNRKGSSKQMELATVEKILNKYRGRRIDWFNWGEPLLHKDLITISEMVRGTRSCVSTNFSLKLSDDYFDALQNFKIVVVSMSGITSSVYDLYHNLGNFDLVMENIKKLSDKKRTRLLIRWLSHKDNEHQYEQAVKYFGEMGYEVERATLNCEVEELMEGFEHPYLKPKVSNRKKQCPIIGRHVIGVDGQYFLCCASHNIPIKISINDNISDEDMINIKMNTNLCQKCQEGKYWRMF